MVGVGGMVGIDRMVQMEWLGWISGRCGWYR